MAANSISIRTGSERENFYKFSIVLIDIGTIISQKYLECIIKLYGYPDLRTFINKNRNLINNNPYLDGVKRIVNGPYYTIKNFEINACAALIQSILLPYYVDQEFIKKTCKNLIKLRDLRNRYFAHICSFTMQNHVFEGLIADLDAIFLSLSGIKGFIFDYRSEINKLMNEDVVEERIRKYFEDILEVFINNNKTQINDFLTKMSLKNNEDIKIFFKNIDFDSFMSSVDNLSILIKENGKTCSSVISSEFKQFSEQMQAQMIKLNEE